MKLSIVLTLFICLALLPSAGAKLKEVGSNYEIHDNGYGVYTATIFSNYKYYPKAGGTYFNEWEMIDENFQSNNCLNQYGKCQGKDNFYKTHMKIDPSNPDFLAFELNNEFLYLNWEYLAIDGKQVNLKPAQTEVNGNKITYILSNKYWMRYTYIANRLKEEIIIHDPDIKNAQVIEAVLKKSNSKHYELISHEFSVCDARDICSFFHVTFDQEYIKMFFNDTEFLKEAELPITIDPAISINSTLWDGYIVAMNVPGDKYTRHDGSRGELITGTSAWILEAISTYHYRSDVDYNMSYFSTLGDLGDLLIENITQYIYVTTTPNNTWGADFYFGISRMDCPDDICNMTYPETEAGDEDFHSDMGSSAEYWYGNVTGWSGAYTLQLEQAAFDDLEDTLEKGKFNWSMGYKINPENKPTVNDGIKFMKWGSSQHGTSAYRHHINITYSFKQPTISIDLVYPTASEIEVMQNLFFPVIVNVTCNINDCGEINVSLDPTIELQTPDTENLEDTHIDQSSASTNFGSDTKLRARGPGFNQGIMYIKFNLTSVPSGTTIDSATLELYRYTGSCNGNDCNTTVYELDNQAWAETTPTWNSPLTGKGSGLDSVFCNSTGWCSWDVTSWVSTEYSDGDDNVSFQLEIDNNIDYIYVYSKENIAAFKPKLSITYSTDEIKSGLVNETIGATPFYVNGSNPETIELNKSQSQQITFQVNSTGDLKKYINWFAYANETANMSNSNQTSLWNVTIIAYDACVPPIFIDWLLNTTCNLRDTTVFNPMGLFIYTNGLINLTNSTLNQSGLLKMFRDGTEPRIKGDMNSRLIIPS